MEPTESYTEAEPATIKRTNRLMQRAGQGRQQEDPELRQLDKMLDKIQAIQNPAAVKPAKTIVETASRSALSRQ